jgi:hypothetical protein
MKLLVEAVIIVIVLDMAVRLLREKVSPAAVCAKAAH